MENHYRFLPKKKVGSYAKASHNFSAKNITATDFATIIIVSKSLINELDTLTKLSTTQPSLIFRAQLFKASLAY